MTGEFLGGWSEKVEEFNLSEKETGVQDNLTKQSFFGYDRKDVKEFIRRLKARLYALDLNSKQRFFLMEELDKLAGDKLI